MPRKRKPIVERFWEKVKKTKSCWIWTGHKTPERYGKINSGGKYGPLVYAHRLSWEIKNGPIPKGLWVLHHCDNPPCVNPKHLHLGTRSDNFKDAVKRRRMKYGVNHPHAKLNNSKVKKMRSLYLSGNFSYNKIARIFKVDFVTARCAIKRYTWKHVK